MDLINLVASYGSWAWVIGGVVLLGIELVMPGGVFVWFGGAAIVTGIVSFVFRTEWPVEWAIFGVLSVVGLAGWQLFRKNTPNTTDSPNLNERAARMIGERGFLSEPIVGGAGRIELGESVWRVSGPNLAVGQLVEVVSFKSNVLEVKAVDDSDRVETA